MLKTKTYADLYRDLRTAVDFCHRDGSLKKAVAANPSKFIHEVRFSFTRYISPSYVSSYDHRRSSHESHPHCLPQGPQKALIPCCPLPLRIPLRTSLIPSLS